MHGYGLAEKKDHVRKRTHEKRTTNVTNADNNRESRTDTVTRKMTTKVTRKQNCERKRRYENKTTNVKNDNQTESCWETDTRKYNDKSDKTKENRAGKRTHPHTHKKKQE